MASLIAGVAALNLVLLAVGYCLLASTLKGVSPRIWPTFAGLALLVGAASIGVALSVLAVFGVRTGASACAAVAGVLAGAGALAAVFLPSRVLQAIRFQIAPPRPEPINAIFASVTAALVAGICALTLFAAFRTTPWLNDAWTFWLPKGLLLSGHGLDQRVFVGTDLVGFANPDYPLWWSILGGLEMDFVGRVDLRAVNAEIAILLAGLVASVARLLWGRVQPWILSIALLVLVISAELLRQTQSGGADVPLALYLALAVLAGALWLSSGAGFFLAITAVAAAAAASIKVEGAPQLALLVAFPALLAWRTVRWRSALLVGALLAAWATSVPWHVWRAVHNVHSEFSLGNGLDPGYLADHAERASPSAHAVISSMVGRGWPLIVPLFFALTIVGVILERRLLWIVPGVAFGACVMFWVWTYWAGPIPLDFWLETSAYRVVDGLLLAAAVTIPLMAERLANAFAQRRVALSAQLQPPGLGERDPA
jgi:hypothetical protein